jgi:hypothetical protein
MALLFIDGADHYVTADRLLKWTGQTGSNVTINATGGRRGSQSIRPLFGHGLEMTLTPTGATCIVGFAWRSNPLATGEMLRISDPTVQHISLLSATGGALEVRRGTASGTVLGTSATGLLVANTYVYVEIKVLIDDVVGTVEVRLNGSASPVLLLTSQDTRNAGTAGWTRVALHNAQSGSPTVDYDDVYMCDANGSAPWNTFLGDVRVDVQYPNANGANVGSTPSTGTDRYATVDETLPNGDTDYNTIVTVGAKDTLGLANLTATGASLLGIQTLLSAKKTDAGTGSVCPVLRHSTTDYDGTSVALTTGYTYVRQVYQTNPGTSTQWTEADFNALEVGYKRTA